jgi:hypothetical protein
MAKRMKIIPEHLYKKFMDLDDTLENRLKESKKNVFDREIPDEIKAVLYQNFQRQLHAKHMSDEKTPILVKNVTAPQTYLETTPYSTAFKNEPSLIPTVPKEKDVEDEEEEEEEEMDFSNIEEGEIMQQQHSNNSSKISANPGTSKNLKHWLDQKEKMRMKRKREKMTRNIHIYTRDDDHNKSDPSRIEELHRNTLTARRLISPRDGTPRVLLPPTFKTPSTSSNHIDYSHHSGTKRNYDEEDDDDDDTPRVGKRLRLEEYVDRGEKRVHNEDDDLFGDVPKRRRIVPEYKFDANAHWQRYMDQSHGKRHRESSDEGERERIKRSRIVLLGKRFREIDDVDGERQGVKRQRTDGLKLLKVKKARLGRWKVYDK